MVNLLNKLLTISSPHYSITILYVLIIYRILGECLLISSLPGKALRKLVDIARLAERFNKHSQSRAW